jgi:hypothetical protein
MPADEAVVATLQRVGPCTASTLSHHVGTTDKRSLHLQLVRLAKEGQVRQHDNTTRASGPRWAA